MPLEARLAEELMRANPSRAAAVLDRLAVEEGAAALQAVEPPVAAPVLARITLLIASEIVERLGPAAAPILEVLEDDLAVRILRRVGEEAREAVLRNLPERTSHTLRTLLQFPENTAGALMDPDVLALAQDLTVEEALARIRQFPDQARYNLYVTDRDQVLVGAINLRELLLAPPEARLERLMVKNPHRLEANADRSRIASHPGWKHVHAIPVVDADDRYLGSVRYRTLRRLEEELLGTAETDVDTASALGDVFASGASGLLEALGSRDVRRNVKRGTEWT